MIVEQDKETSLTLRVNTGTVSSPTYANRTFNNINPELTKAKSYNLLQFMGGLQAHDVSACIRTDKATLVEDD